MVNINCLECEHWRGGQLECQYGFRMASDGGGRAVDCKEDVWRCQDFSEKENENDEYV